MTEKIGSIQVLRGIAALAVVVAHASLETNFIAPNEQTVMPYWLRYGAAGVDLFFVISGFVMVVSSDRLFGTPGGSVTFAARRLIRIVPLYWIMTSAVLLQWWLHGFTFTIAAIAPECVSASYLFIPCERGGHFTPVLAAAWTLNFEMFFYVLFAIAVMLPRRQAVLAVVALLCVLTAARGLWPLPALNYLAARPIGANVHGIVLEFAFGAVIALAYREGFRLSRGVALGLIAAALIAFLVVCRFALHEISLPVFWGLPCAAIVAGAVALGDPQKPGRAWLWLLTLGNASYALYLTHGLVHSTVRYDALPVARWVLDVSPWLYATGLVALAVAVAQPVYALVERPITDALRRAAPPLRNAVIRSALQPRPARPEIASRLQACAGAWRSPADSRTSHRRARSAPK